MVGQIARKKQVGRVAEVVVVAVGWGVMDTNWLKKKKRRTKRGERAQYAVVVVVVENSIDCKCNWEAEAVVVELVGIPLSYVDNW